MATDTRSRMIHATQLLLQHKGIHGTSLNEILARSRAPRGSLYFHFPGGKDQLVREALLRGVEEATQAIRQVFERTPDAAEGVRSIMLRSADELKRTDFLFGCPVAPTILDSPEDSSAIAAACAEALEEWLRLFTGALVSDGINPERARKLAALIVAAEEGAILIARARRDVEPLETIADELAALIRAEFPVNRTG